MKAPATLTAPILALFMTTSLVSADTTSTTFPGRCVTNADCTPYGKNLACIAVDSNIAGLEKLNMCIPTGNICSGSIAGICPTFSSWPSKYRKVQTVCAFLEAPNCNKKIEVEDPKTSGSSANDGNGDVNAGDGSQTGSNLINANETVECYTRNFTVNNEFKVVNGIYQCMDVKKYNAVNGGHLRNFTDSQIVACGGTLTDTSITLCNGQGTCSPVSAFSEVYACKCNKGYDGDKFCKTVTSNECSNLGQCGALGTCTLTGSSTTGTCTCKSGSTGNQCATCDSTKGSAACSDHGKCENGVCTCDSGYGGTFCSDTKTTTSTDNGVASLFTTVGASFATALALGVMVFA